MNPDDWKTKRAEFKIYKLIHTLDLTPVNHKS